MASAPFISKRIYIKWGDDPARENTETIVLTTAAKYFVDIRIFVPSSLSLSPSLEWAFAGTACSTLAVGDKPAHTVWTHWVDSKTTEEVQDEGDMYLQDNGEVLEYGEMGNPAKGGIIERYEECWVDLDAEVVDGENAHKTWVFKVGGNDENVKGMIARIGQYIQGVIRKGDEIGVGRWLWSADKGWDKTEALGNLEIPMNLFDAVYNVTVGEKLEGSDGLIWECVESHNWD